jgi:hypothetical protein
MAGFRVLWVVFVLGSLRAVGTVGEGRAGDALQVGQDVGRPAVPDLVLGRVDGESEIGGRER